MGSNICPFDDPSLCDNSACSCVNWKTMHPMPEKCKKKINSYCRTNFKDSKCRELRKNKCNAESSNNSSRYSNNVKNKNSKKSNINLDNYIRRDKIPCWGCNL